MLLRRLEARQVVVALVELLDVEGVLEPRVVEVVLLVEVGDEPVGAVAEAVDLAARVGLGRHGSLGYGPVQELTLTTERHTQLIDVTQLVRDAVGGEAGRPSSSTSRTRRRA